MNLDIEWNERMAECAIVLSKSIDLLLGIVHKGVISNQLANVEGSTYVSFDHYKKGN